MSDLIERQVAIDALDKRFDSIPMEQTAEILQLRKDLRELPSAQQEQKTAHWVPLDERFASWSSYYKCSECGFRINLRTVTDFGILSVDYCPHCGAKMEVNK